MVFPIYEGTSQIQALMAMKDTLLDAVNRPEAFMRRQGASRWRAMSSRDALDRGVGRLQVLREQTVLFLLTRLAASKVGTLRDHSPLSWRKVLADVDPKRDFALAMLHAERLCQLLADVVIAEELWKVAEKFPERREVLERHLERAEPRARHLNDVITSTGGRLLGILAGENRQGA